MRAHDDAPHIQAKLLVAGIDAEIVYGPVVDAPDSAFWLVFEHDLQWHLASVEKARRERFVILRFGGPTPFATDGEAASVTYANAAVWSEPAAPGVLALRTFRLPVGETLAEQLASYLRALESPSVPQPAVRGPFPIGETLGGGSFRVEQHLLGDFQKLFLGRDTQSGREVIIAFDALSTRVDVRAFRQTVAYESPGVFPLAFVGKFDLTPGIDLSEATSTWALVERVPNGGWLPSILGRFGPEVVLEQESRQLPSYDAATALPDAFSLGRSAGRILADAVANGLILARVRPEYMWAERRTGPLEVTGLSARADALFARSTIDAGVVPIFDRYYYAPETDNDDDVDDRALVFSLSIMIAEWATGRFPYKFKFHDLGPLSGKHLKLALPKPIASVLSRGMALDRSKRPHLLEFLEALDVLAAG
ncbi:MAG: hypothetical protein M4D80_41280 [Myxococcota bacterium]|nr:hypothetical protein [Myxococcota bacterium]